MLIVWLASKPPDWLKTGHVLACAGEAVKSRNRKESRISQRTTEYPSKQSPRFLRIVPPEGESVVCIGFSGYCQ